MGIQSTGLTQTGTFGSYPVLVGQENTPSSVTALPKGNEPVGSMVTLTNGGDEFTLTAETGLHLINGGKGKDKIQLKGNFFNARLNTGKNDGVKDTVTIGPGKGQVIHILNGKEDEIVLPGSKSNYLLKEPNQFQNPLNGNVIQVQHPESVRFAEDTAKK